jgi:EmrB/QacA subfamily drug resistance transporter
MTSSVLAPDVQRESQQISRGSWLILIAMTGSLSMILLDQTVVTVALPSMSRQLPLSISGAQWVVNAYVLGMAALVAVGGKLGDVLGRVTTFRVGVATFFVASAACGLVPAGPHAEALLIAARVSQAVGAALMAPVSAAIVMAAFPTAKRGQVMAVYAGISQMLLALGPLVGGLLTQYVSWRAVFWLNVPVGIASLVLVQYARPANARQEHARLRARDVLLMTASTGAVVFAVQQSNAWGWGSASIVGTLVVGLAIGAVFMRTQLRSAEPLVDVRLFVDRAFLGDNAVMGLVQFGLLGVALFSSIYGQTLLGFSPARAGVNALALVIPLTLSAQVGGRWFDRSGVRGPVLTGLALSFVGLAMWTASLPHLDYWWQVPGMIVAGAGLGLTVSPTNTDGLARVTSAERGQASGLIQTVRQLGGAFGVAVIGTVVVHASAHGTARVGSHAAAVHLADAITWGFGVATAGFALAFIAGWLLLGRNDNNQTAE